MSGEVYGKPEQRMLDDVRATLDAAGVSYRKSGVSSMFHDMVGVHLDAGALAYAKRALREAGFETSGCNEYLSAWKRRGVRHPKRSHNPRAWFGLSEPVD